MNITRKLVFAASALAITGGIGLGGSALAAPKNPGTPATQHCPSTMTKVPADGTSTSESAGSLSDGTEVCLKIGTRICFTTVQGGMVTNNDDCVQTDGTLGIRNQNGVLQNISYWSYGECTDPYGCDPSTVS